MELEQLQTLVVNALEDMKAREITVLDVRGKSTITDVLVIASGTSTRHVKALADSVAVKVKEAGHKPLGIEGERDAEWVLVDLDQIIVHVMLPNARDFYNLEKLWGTASAAEFRLGHQQRAA